MVTWLVCGGREYRTNRAAAILDVLAEEYGSPDLVIQGGASGADAGALIWAETHGIHYATVPALWDEYGRSAGPKRNAVMATLARALGESPGNKSLVVALPGGHGTENMINQAKRESLSGIRVVGWDGETLSIEDL